MPKKRQITFWREKKKYILSNFGILKKQTLKLNSIIKVKIKMKGNNQKLHRCSRDQFLKCNRNYFVFQLKKSNLATITLFSV